MGMSGSVGHCNLRDPGGESSSEQETGSEPAEEGLSLSSGDHPIASWLASSVWTAKKGEEILRNSFAFQLVLFTPQSKRSIRGSSNIKTGVMPRLDCFRIQRTNSEIPLSKYYFSLQKATDRVSFRV